MSAKRDPIPPNAKMVFKGVIFEVWQWEQKMFDGSTATFERLKRPGTAQVVAIVGDKILILDEEQPDSGAPFPSIPGGRLDAGEQPLDAAKRELLEETGYVSDHWELWLETSPVAKIEWTVSTFVALNCRKVSEPHLDAGERISQKLLTFDEFLALSDDTRFCARELVEHLLRARLDEKKKTELRQMLFPHAA